MCESHSDLVATAIEKGFVEHVAHIVNTVMLDWNRDEADALKRFENGLRIARRAMAKMMEAQNANSPMA